MHERSPLHSTNSQRDGLEIRRCDESPILPCAPSTNKGESRKNNDKKDAGEECCSAKKFHDLEDIKES